MTPELHPMLAPHRAARLLSLVVAALGASVLVGWALDIAALKSVFTVRVTMRASAAMALLLCGVALAVLSRRRVTTSIRVGTTVVAVAVIAFGTIALAEEIYGWNLGIDRRLLGILGGGGRASGPGRISPPTALGFMLAGFALATAARPVSFRLRRPLVGGLGAALIIFGGMSLIGHLFSALLDLRILNYIRMAIYTAIGFVLLGGAFLALVRTEGRLNWSLDFFTTAAFAVGIATVLIAASSSFNLTDQLSKVSAQVGHSEETLREIQEVRAAMATLSSGERGYIITGDPRLLEQRERLKAGVQHDLGEARRLVADDPDQVRRMDPFEALIGRRFEWEERAIAARREQGFVEAQRLVATGTGMALNDSITAAIKEIEDHEYAALDERREQAGEVAAKTFLLLPLEVFVSLTMLALGLFFLNEGMGERKRTVDAMRKSEALFHTTFDSMQEGCQLIGFDWRYRYVNAGVSAQARRTKDQLLGHTMTEVFPGIVKTAMFDALRRCMEERTPHVVEHRVERRDGSVEWLDVRMQPVPEGILVVSVDITQRKAEAEKLRESDLRFRQLAENIREVFWLTDSAKNEMLYVSPAYDEIWGRRVQDLYTSPLDWINAIHPEDRGRVLEAAQTKQTRGDYCEEYRIVRPDGATRWIIDKAFPIRDGDGRVVRVAGIAEDITIQKRVQEELRESERRFSDMLRNVELVSLMLDRNARITYCNDHLLRLTGWAREELLGRDYFDAVIPRDDHHTRGVFSALLDDRPIAWHHENEILTRSGERRLIRWSNTVLRSVSGNVTGTASIGEDITERTRTAEVQARLAAIVESSDDAIIGKDINGIVTSWNAGAMKIFGYTSAEMVGRPIQRLLPPDRIQEGEHILNQIRRGENVDHFETVRIRSDGQPIHVAITVSPIRDAAGNVVGASKIARDSSERRQLEHQLRQSQKLEAIGQLTGGIAHDFNNLLGVILGNLDLLERLVAGDEAAVNRVRIARKAASRGADLTRRMLVFSSQQPLHPAPTSLVESIRNTVEMAARALGPEISIATTFDPAVPAVFVDAAGLESVLLNLVVNARDAMPRGGSLTISTSVGDADEHPPPMLATELKPGRYARITVADTGNGMTAETLDRAFEPFFTTKPRGKGTGLGLAMVYGFIKQSGGTVRIDSEPRRGTTVVLHLPLAKVGLPAAILDAEPDAQAKDVGTVLVVDDDADLLEVAVAHLGDMGYRVFHAADGASALEIIDREPAIDLLLTDLMMPGGMNGWELAQRVAQRRPGIRIVYSSGYPSSALSDRSGEHADAPLLYKPFHRSEFVATIRRAMAGRDTKFGEDAAIGA